jgi:hypothetical protein
MRAPILTLLAVAAIATSSFAGKPLPRGDDRFQLGMTRPELDYRVMKRRLQPLSVGRNNLAVSSDDPAIEFERYVIVPLKQKDVLAEVMFAYHVPHSRAGFDSVRDALIETLGAPAEHLRPGENPAGLDRESVSWTDGRVLVRLTARWTEIPDPLSDRMTVTWSDIQLRQAVLGNQHASKPKK